MKVQEMKKEEPKQNIFANPTFYDYEEEENVGHGKPLNHPDNNGDALMLVGAGGTAMGNHHRRKNKTNEENKNSGTFNVGKDISLCSQGIFLADCIHICTWRLLLYVAFVKTGNNLI